MTTTPIDTDALRRDWQRDALEVPKQRVSPYLYLYAVETLLSLCDEVDLLRGLMVELTVETTPRPPSAEPQPPRWACAPPDGPETCGCAR